MALTAEGTRGARPRLIITADDFGRDAVCTAAIAEHLAEGTITATSIIANGACFAEACEIARARRLTDKIGMHLVFDEGPPLSREMDVFADASGNLSVTRSLMWLGSRFTAAVDAECVAQVERVIAAGIRPTHLDSHRHLHTRFPIGRVVVGVARRFAIPYLRPARNLQQSRNLLKTAYKSLYNRYVASRVGCADYFGDIEDFFQHRYPVPPGSLIECMVHLDGSPRGRSGQRLLHNAEFQRFLAGYELVGHTPVGR
jgi:predicted glycoside hydrolase/deacetylase ChbG (UPF0249 family)